MTKEEPAAAKEIETEKKKNDAKNKEEQREATEEEEEEYVRHRTICDAACKIFSGIRHSRNARLSFYASYVRSKSQSRGGNAST